MHQMNYEVRIVTVGDKFCIKVFNQAWKTADEFFHIASLVGAAAWFDEKADFLDEFSQVRISEAAACIFGPKYGAVKTIDQLRIRIGEGRAVQQTHPTS